MILATYPIQLDTQFVRNPTHDCVLLQYDTKKKTDSMEVLLMLLANYGNDLVFYNMSSRSEEKNHYNIDSLIRQFNTDEFDFENRFCILLELEESDIDAVMQDYKRDFVIINEKKPTRFGDGEMIVYGDIDSAMQDLYWSDGNELYCLLSLKNQRNGNAYDVIVYEFTESRTVSRLGQFKASRTDSKKWFETSYHYARFIAEHKPQKVYVVITQYVNTCKLEDTGKMVVVFASHEEAKKCLEETFGEVRSKFFKNYSSAKIMTDGVFYIHDTDYRDWWSGNIFPRPLIKKANV